MTREEAFETFWKAYPRRVGKGHARKAFEKSIRKTTIEAMLAAIELYVRHKPERIDFKHPATWLNGECWDDEWQSVPTILPPSQPRRPTMADLAFDLFPAGGSNDRTSH